MGTSTRPCWIGDHEGAKALHLEGVWRLAVLRERAAQLAELGLDGRGGDAPSLVVGAGLTEVDTAGALLVLARLQDAGVEPADVVLAGFDPGHARILDVVRTRLAELERPEPVRRFGALARLGQRAASLGDLLAGHVAFLGRVLFDLAEVVRRPRLLRVHELFAQLGQVGVGAVPVVSLVTFLIGIVFAYLLGLQAERYGANIFVVDGVALGMTREFAPLMVATIVAGRSGAAFTAQLGTMKLTEEIDAIRTLGLSPEQVLIVPRVLALVIALPLLVFVGDVMSLTGAMLMAGATLDITPTTFIDRLGETLAPRHYLIGIGKAPVFALFIAVIGCRMGVSVSRDTRSIGINTTSTVVQSIVAVILLDAFFAVLFQQLGL
jgi:phospholipid/cholesterol/gamma-HCH transport system permease protein